MKQILLTQGKFAKVDDYHYDLAIKYKWHTHKGRMTDYAATNIRQENGRYKTVLLHRLILNVTDKEIHIDHIDFDGLNCTTENIRESTRSQNSMNGRVFGMSKYLGVSIATMKRSYGTYKYWKATAGLNRKKKYLGVFPYNEQGEIMAAKAYDEFAKNNFGEFANLNFK